MFLPLTQGLREQKHNLLLLEASLTRGIKEFTIRPIMNEIDPLKQFQIS